jgi:hypothetical protein
VRGCGGGGGDGCWLLGRFACHCVCLIFFTIAVVCVEGSADIKVVADVFWPDVWIAFLKSASVAVYESLQTHWPGCPDASLVSPPPLLSAEKPRSQLSHLSPFLCTLYTPKIRRPNRTNRSHGESFNICSVTISSFLIHFLTLERDRVKHLGSYG